jgi:enamine deaminase RidA (YjgF/YER057c/UK114 family)
MAKRNVVWPANPHALYTEHRYSPAVRSNGHLFVSGQVGVRDDGSPEPDLEAQVRLAFQRLNDVLDAAGVTFDDVVDTTLFIVNPQETFDTIFRVMPEFWGEPPYSNITAVGVTWLAGFQFEIKVIAKLPEPANG